MYMSREWMYMGREWMYMDRECLYMGREWMYIYKGCNLWQSMYMDREWLYVSVLVVTYIYINEFSLYMSIKYCDIFN